ncbi:autotransporter-associated beta strand repeat-containing protein, partial [Aquirufa sp.]|uniref:autotransporter-associated beta strand repeat-containing protein n=1 Tax=Aquirufa sp. TaxID=2676249 RepID=UPI003784D3DF
DITITTTNSVVDGSNVGVSGVISGRNFTKSGAGILRLSGTNTYAGRTTIAAGTLQLGTGTNIPDASAVYFAGGNLNDGGFNETMGALFLSNSSSITMQNSTHSLTFASAGTFAGYASNTLLTIIGYNGLGTTTAVDTYGMVSGSSTVFVTLNGKKQNVVNGGLNQFGRILSGSLSNPNYIFIKSALTATQLGQIQFYDSIGNNYYSTTQKPVAGTNGEIVPGSPK